MNHEKILAVVGFLVMGGALSWGALAIWQSHRDGPACRAACAKRGMVVLVCSKEAVACETPRAGVNVVELQP